MGRQDYLSGTREALTRLSQWFCYFPGCSRTVIEFVGGHPMFSVDAAHIHEAEPGVGRRGRDTSVTRTRRSAPPEVQHAAPRLRS
jgi:hypothetical protein